MQLGIVHYTERCSEMDQRVPLWTPEGRSGTASRPPPRPTGRCPEPRPLAGNLFYSKAASQKFFRLPASGASGGTGCARPPTHALRYGGSAPTTPAPSKCLYGISHILHFREKRQVRGWMRSLIQPLPTSFSVLRRLRQFRCRADRRQERAARRQLH